MKLICRSWEDVVCGAERLFIFFFAFSYYLSEQLRVVLHRWGWDISPLCVWSLRKGLSKHTILCFGFFKKQLEGELRWNSLVFICQFIYSTLGGFECSWSFMKQLSWEIHDIFFFFFSRFMTLPGPELIWFSVRHMSSLHASAGHSFTLLSVSGQFFFSPMLQGRP